MTAAADIVTLDPPAGRSAPLARTRPFYWSVRRELWEHHSIWIAPLVAAGVILAGFMVAEFNPQGIHLNMSSGHGGHVQRTQMPVWAPYAIATVAIMLSAFVAAVFYCLGALQNERRDRSILFWKSLPVSDRTAVLAKAFIPFVVVPLVVLAVLAVTQLIMIGTASALTMARGGDVQALWTAVPMLRLSVVMVYGLTILTLWHAPLWGWLLAVSAWSKRTAFLWAFGPPIALSVFERIAHGTSYLSKLFGDRMIGGWGEGFTVHRGQMALTDISDIDVGKFVSNPEMWGGLVVGAGLIAAAVWLRRRREPI